MSSLHPMKLKHKEQMGACINSIWNDNLNASQFELGRRAQTGAS